MRIILVPSYHLSADITFKRCAAALKLWQKGGYDLIVLSGGNVRSEFSANKPLAETMLAWCQQQPNCPPLDKIKLVDFSRDTYEDVSGTLSIIGYREGEKDLDVTITTDWLQGKRFLLTLNNG